MCLHTDVTGYNSNRRRLQTQPSVYMSTHPRSNVSDGVYWKRLREDAGITQEDASQRLGISRVTLSRYETGGRDVPDETMRDMLREYGAVASGRTVVPVGLTAHDVRGIRYAAEAMSFTLGELLRTARELEAVELATVTQFATEHVQTRPSSPRSLHPETSAVDRRTGAPQGRNTSGAASDRPERKRRG